MIYRGKRTNYRRILKACRRYNRNIDVFSRYNLIPTHRNVIGLYSDSPMYVNNPPYYQYYEDVSLMLDNYNVNGHDIENLHPSAIEKLRKHQLQLIGVDVISTCERHGVDVISTCKRHYIDYNTVKIINNDNLVKDLRRQLVHHVMFK